MTINLLQPEVPEIKLSSVWQRSSRFITCLFCGLRGRAVGDSPLCSNCHADPVQTRTAIYLAMSSVDRREAAAFAEWSAFAAQHADDWDRLCAARAALSAEEFAQRAAQHRAAGNIYGQLLDAQAAYETTLAPLAAERARLEEAERAIDDARAD